MSENQCDDLLHTLREHGARYVVGAEGHPVAVLLTLGEYDHYLDLLDDAADSQDAELAARLTQAAARSACKERQFFDSLTR
jgi:PHD/YefM family antitoxin component YafN of YafNO toxin-antitoxin module